MADEHPVLVPFFSTRHPVSINWLTEMQSSAETYKQDQEERNRGKRVGALQGDPPRVLDIETLITGTKTRQQKVFTWGSTLTKGSHNPHPKECEREKWKINRQLCVPHPAAARFNCRASIPASFSSTRTPPWNTSLSAPLSIDLPNTSWKNKLWR